MDTFNHLIGMAQEGLFENLIQPVLYKLGLSSVIEDAYDATLWLIAGLLQIAVLVCVIGPLQRWRPVEAITDRRAVRVDILYTLIHRLGLFRVALFFAIDPFWDSIFGSLHVWGLPTFQLDNLWPGVTDNALVSLAIYLLVFDLVEYLYHRAQHNVEWMWALHAVHHSQRQMTMWSDNRNHLLDDVLHDVVIVIVSQLIGVAPAQFVAIVAILQLVESFSHANLRVHFGKLGERLIVSPRFHREHHGIAYETTPTGKVVGSNYAVIFPIWDILFRSARFDGGFGPTGIADQLPEAGGRDYGETFLAQQWLGFKRLLRLGRRRTRAA
ncbi:sterol desaturase family protein [Bordetella bronchialis]|uniref:Fatty acid hydroxylase n=1 Tax=Bordetella bronchialis TaxID=463025 RepID=A0A193G109_9BORD|nr:sterol desaturase family protein [Bordetella bronchialis]ANN68409.1 fatty acid hydroxylase [Bordetella bronchialis]ANN73550.1 fatty acid hydroxylase [Bordetella bronchialis]